MRGRQLDRAVAVAERQRPAIRVAATPAVDPGGRAGRCGAGGVRRSDAGALYTNPLAEPGLLGVPNGAGISLVLGVLFGSGSLCSLSLAAMAGALLITLILLHFAHRQLSVTRRLLTGVALGIICSAIMT